MRARSSPAAPSRGPNSLQESDHSCALGNDPDHASTRTYDTPAHPQHRRADAQLRRTRRPRRDRPGPGRERHRAHLRHPGTHPAAGDGRRRPHRSGPHRHGQDLRLRRATAAPHQRRRESAAQRHAPRTGGGAHPRVVHPGLRGPQARGQISARRRRPRVHGDVHLRRASLRAADRGAAEGRRRRRRHSGPAARSGPAGPPATGRALRAGARRGRRDARPRLPARHRTHPQPHPRRPAVDAVLGHHARPDHHPGPHLHEPAHPHPRRGRAGCGHSRHHRAVRLPRARAGQDRDGRAHPAGRGPRRDDDLHPHQAHRAEGGRRPRRARVQSRRRPRRPRAGGPREGAQVVPRGRRRRAGRHRRRRPRHRHRRHHPRDQLPDPRGRAGLRAPHRTHRPRG